MLEIKIVTDRAVDKARAYGYDDPEDDLKFIAGLSAPITHPYGNRRFEDVLLRVDGGVVADVHFLKCETCLDRKKVVQFDTCSRCDCGGENIGTCKHRQRRNVPCPDC